jgi:hypothetical protein
MFRQEFFTRIKDTAGFLRQQKKAYKHSENQVFGSRKIYFEASNVQIVIS